MSFVFYKLEDWGGLRQWAQVMYKILEDFGGLRLNEFWILQVGGFGRIEAVGTTHFM